MIPCNYYYFMNYCASTAVTRWKVMEVGEGADPLYADPRIERFYKFLDLNWRVAIYHYIVLEFTLCEYSRTYLAQTHRSNHITYDHEDIKDSHRNNGRYRAARAIPWISGARGTTHLAGPPFHNTQHYGIHLLVSRFREHNFHQDYFRYRHRASTFKRIFLLNYLCFYFQTCTTSKKKSTSCHWGGGF